MSKGERFWESHKLPNRLFPCSSGMKVRSSGWRRIIRLPTYRSVADGSSLGSGLRAVLRRGRNAALVLSALILGQSEPLLTSWTVVAVGRKTGNMALTRVPWPFDWISRVPPNWRKRSRIPRSPTPV